MNPGNFAQIGPLFYSSFWMLLWAAAAALPLIIHLWNRRKYREVRWAAMEYLLRAMKKNSRRIQIEQLLLLIVRIMIVVLAALAWMNWMLSDGPLLSPLGGSDSTHVVLVLDASYSMDYRTDETTRFERAKQLAIELVDNAARGDGFSLVLMSDPPQVIINEPAFDAEDVKQEIGELKLRHTDADLSATFAAADALIRSVAEDNDRITQHRVVVISDLQQNTWKATADDDTLKLIDRINTTATTTLLDVGDGMVDNATVTSFAILENVVVPGRGVTFSAQVKNNGEAAIFNRKIELLINGRPIDQQTVSIDPGDETSVAFSYRFETPGEHVAMLQLGDDALMVDNVRWLSVPVRSAVEVLLVEGVPGAARYVDVALAPNSATSTIRTTVTNEAALLERNLSYFDCIFLCNVGRFGRDEATVLADYLRQGGGVVTFLGDQVVPESYNQNLSPAESDSPVLPVELGEPAELGEYRFDPRDYRHFLTRPFRATRTGLTTARTWKYIELRVPKETTANIAMWFDNGDPAIVEQKIGRGYSVVVATAASTQSVDRSTQPPTPWSAQASKYHFTPLMHRLLMFATQGQFDNRNVAVGEPLASSVRTLAGGLTIDITPPGQAPQRLHADIEGEDSHWRFSSTYQTGIYNVVIGKPINQTEQYAVNFSVEESDLQRISKEELPAAMRHQADVPTQSAAADNMLQRRQPLFRWLLGMVLVLLLVESLLAWRFGNQAA